MLLICLTISSYSQEAPAPTNIIATSNKICGNADPKTTVIVETDVNGTKSKYNIVVNYKGYFEHTFNPVLTPLSILSIWTVDETGKELASHIEVAIETPEVILTKISKGEIKLPNNTPPIPEPKPVVTHIPNNPDINNKQPNSTTYKYKVTMINTNFTVPIVRFNLTSNDGKTKKDGDILLFNSIGAGVGMSYGNLERTTDDKGEIINNDFTSSFGIHFGFLFSASSSSTENKNVFAPTISLSVLDFQLGYGYEMGTRDEFQKRHFFTIAYAIPISKLIKSKYYIRAASKGYNDLNPLPADEENLEYKNMFL